MDAEPVLEARGICKHFTGTVALDNVDFAVWPNEIHGLVGANGAGKSTLVKILAGVYDMDAGEISIDGESCVIDSIDRAGELGLRFVHQQHVVVPSLNGVENVLLGARLPLRAGRRVDWKEARRRAEEIMATTGFSVDLDLPAGQLPVADQKLLEIMRALAAKAKIIVLDEPTASLGDEEATRLMADLRKLAASGIAVVYISHRLEEILGLCDRVTVIRNGKNVATVEAQDLNKPRLVELIVGAEMEYEPPAETRPAGAEVLACEDLHYGTKVKGVSFKLHAGEVVGLAGLQGSGRTEIAEMLFGAVQPDRGSIFRNGKVVKWASSAQAIESGIGMVPEDRHKGGLVLNMSIAQNITLPSLRKYVKLRWLPWLSDKRGADEARDQIKKLSIMATGPDQGVSDLSGGNQQKVVLGKWLATHPKVVILDEPTHGVDVGAKAEIYTIISTIASEGTAVLIIASELAELVETCDRVFVICQGQISEEIQKHQLSEERLLGGCFGRSRPEAATTGGVAS